LNSTTGKDAVDNLPFDEQVLVMEGLVDKLRQVGEWKSRPEGFYGAVLLARKAKEPARLLKRFLATLDFAGRTPPWFNASLKNETWFRE